MKTQKASSTGGVTRVIAGQSITLPAGRNYIAGRPFSELGRKVYPVKIALGKYPLGEPVLTIPGLSYDQANELVNAFNNGRSSFLGRDW